MADLKPFKGTLQPYKKVCVIEKGLITRMYWEHPAGNKEFDHDEVINRWLELYRGEDRSHPDFTGHQFLSNHGFAMQNVIRDGSRMTA